MGSVVLQVDTARGWVGPAKGFDPTITSGQLNAGEVMGLLSDGDASATKTIVLGDGTSTAAQWNHFYLTVPTLPAGVLAAELQTTWFIAANFGNTEQVVIQVHPQPYNAGEARVTPISTAPTAYAANFPGWNPAWPRDSIVVSVLGSVAESVTEIIAVLYYAEPPGVSFVKPANGSTISDTVRPTVQWNYVPGINGGPQSAYRIWLYTQAQTQAAGFVPGSTTAVWDSREVNSSVSAAAVPINLANNTTYVAYLQVAQTVNGFKQWCNGFAVTNFTVSIPAASVPARPTITATADSPNARIALNVSQSGTPVWDHVIVQRSNDSGVTWVPVRGGDVPIAAGDTLAIYDYESGNGESVVYRAQAQRTSTVAGITQVTVSQFSTLSTPTSWSSSDVWLKSPLFPAFNTTIRLGQFGTFTRRIARGVFDVVGRPKPVVVSDVRHGLEGQMTVSVRSTAELDSIRFMSDLSSTVLLQTPPSFNFGSKYLALGDEREDRINIVASNAYRWVQFDFTEVDSPVGDAAGIYVPPVVQPPAVSISTWDDVSAAAADWATLANRYTAWADLSGLFGATYDSLTAQYVTWAGVMAAYASWTALVGGTDIPTPPVTGYLLDEAGNVLTDESGNRLTAT